MTIKVKNSVAKYTLFAILIISSNIITAQTFAENQEDNYFISISVSQQTKAAPDQMAFRDWYELLANILLSGKTYDIYNDPHYLSNFIELLLESNYWDSLSLPSKNSLIKSLLPELAWYLRTSYNGSLTFVKAITSFSHNYDPFVNAFLFLRLINMSKNILNPSTYCKFSITKLANYTLNGLFVREINGSIKIGLYGFQYPEYGLPDLLYEGLLDYLHYSPFCDKIEVLIGNTLLALANSTNLEENWVKTTYIALIMAKFGQFSNNLTFIQKSQETLNKLFSKDYYVNDGIIYSFKLQITKDIIAYNLSYAKAIVDSVIPAFFNTPLGIQPIICSLDQTAMNNLKKGMEYIGCVRVSHLSVLEDLAEATNNDTYHVLLQDILKFYFSQLYFNQEENTWYEAYSSRFKIDSPNEWYAISIIVWIQEIQDLIRLIEHFSLDEKIDDPVPPNATVSYYYDEFALFSSNLEVYKTINDTAKINYTNEKALFIRMDLSDIGFGYKYAEIFKNDIAIKPLRFSFSNETTFYYEMWPSSFLPIKNVAVRSIFIPINTPLTESVQYTIKAYDKIGNILNVDITVNQELRDDTFLTETATNTAKASYFPIIIVLYLTLSQIRRRWKIKK
ncbi:MAG: hypothetical protein ACTSYD_08740 [Candidatus Heimdallarchaeaceae archaeon]